MKYTEKITVHGRNVVIKRNEPPVKVEVEEGQGWYPLQKLNVNDERLAPSNYDNPDGVPMTLYQCEDGMKVDLSKRSKEEMGYWHRSTEFDELIFCHRGSIVWETELGEIKLEEGEMFVIPRGIAHRSKPGMDREENIVIELKLPSRVRKVVELE